MHHLHLSRFLTHCLFAWLTLPALRPCLQDDFISDVDKEISKWTSSRRKQSGGKAKSLLEELAELGAELGEVCVCASAGRGRRGRAAGGAPAWHCCCAHR